MIQEHIDWLDARPHILKNTSITQEELVKLYEIYNAVTGLNTKPTRCGRCVNRTKQTIKHYYDKDRS